MKTDKIFSIKRLANIYTENIRDKSEYNQYYNITHASLFISGNIQNKSVNYLQSDIHEKSYFREISPMKYNKGRYSRYFIKN